MQHTLEDPTLHPPGCVEAGGIEGTWTAEGACKPSLGRGGTRSPVACT